jgi:hypothetical protein
MVNMEIKLSSANSKSGDADMELLLIPLDGAILQQTLRDILPQTIRMPNEK